MDLTVANLLEMLEDLPPETPVRMAQQPSWPFEYSIAEPVLVETEEDGPVLYLPERQQTRYLPGEVSAELGWRE